MTLKKATHNSKKDKEIPRGIRNNNPLNIRIGNVWLGEVQVNTDGEFEQFVNMRYGLRAAFVLLRRYICHYRLTTIAQIISRWAPASENMTENYIGHVAKMTSLATDQSLDYYDKVTMCKLVQAMAYYECGEIVSMSVIEAGYDMA